MLNDTIMLFLADLMHSITGKKYLASKLLLYSSFIHSISRTLKAFYTTVYYSGNAKFDSFRYAILPISA